MPRSLASVSTVNCLLKSGRASIEADISCCCSNAKVVGLIAVQVNGDTFLEQIEQGPRDDTKILDETAIVSGEAQEVVHCLGICGCGPAGHCMDLLRISGDALGIDHMSQIRNMLLVEGALGVLHFLAILAQQGEHLPQLLDVLLQSLVIHEYVVKEDEHSMAGLQGALMTSLNVDGPPAKPNESTVNSKWLKLVWKVVLCSSPSASRIWCSLCGD